MKITVAEALASARTEILERIEELADRIALAKEQVADWDKVLERGLDEDEVIPGNPWQDLREAQANWEVQFFLLKKIEEVIPK